MNPDMRIKLKTLLISHEGKESLPYLDTEGKVTIGIGRNLTDVGLREDEIDYMYKNDVDFFYTQLSKIYPWFLELNEARQIALVDMAFMGLKKFATFKKMIAALSMHNYSIAAIELLNSNYARKLQNRANQLANIILTGVL